MTEESMNVEECIELAKRVNAGAFPLLWQTRELARCLLVLADDPRIKAGANRSAEVESDQVVGRIWRTPGRPVRAMLNSVGKELPDDAPLYRAPQSATGTLQTLRSFLENTPDTDCEWTHGYNEAKRRALKLLDAVTTDSRSDK